MSYLYGDSTESPLTSNFLEFLRDALDFSATALRADAHIANVRERLRAASAVAEVETGRLERFVAGVASAITAGDKGGPDSPAARCATRVAALLADAHDQTLDALRERLASEERQVDADEAATRAACREALARLLAAHDPHDAERSVRLALAPEGDRYEASLSGAASFGLAWTFAVVIPAASRWAAPLRVETLLPEAELRAPQVTGWISKEVKVRPQKLGQHVVTSLVDDGRTVTFALRAEVGADAGFDAEVDPSTRAVTVSRTGASDDPSVGPFRVEGEDIALLVDLARRLRAACDDLARGELLRATVEEVDFRELPSYGPLVERFVAYLTPIVREIANRSLTADELVLRRALGDDRREEIFVTKATLRGKYAELDEPLRAMFLPLGLEREEGRTRSSSAGPPGPPEPHVRRAELAPSQPPPATSYRPASMSPSQPPPEPRLSSERVRGPGSAPEIEVAEADLAIDDLQR